MVDQRGESPSLELGRYAAVLRRRWPTVLLCTLVGLLLAIAYVTLAPTKVTATSLVNINPIRTDAFDSQRSASGLIDPITEEQLAKSSDVFRQSALALGQGATVADVRRQMQADVLPDATVVKISFTAPTVAEAVRGADIVGQAYIDSRTNAAVAKVDRVTTKLDRRRDEIQAQVAKVTAALNRATPNSRQASEAASQRQSLNLTLTSVLSQIATLDAIDTKGGTVVTNASDSPVAVSPHRRLLLEIGLALGLALGLVAAFVLNALDRRVRDASTVTKAGGGDVLAELRDTKGAVPTQGRDLDEIRSAGEQLLAKLPRENPVLAVVDLTGATAPNDVAANLALALAETGRIVNLLLPEHSEEFVGRLSSAFGVASTPGGSGLPGPVITLPAATTGAQPAATRMTVIVLPARASRSLTLASARRTDAQVFVVAKGRTRGKEVTAVANDLRALGSSVVGSIVVPKTRRLDLAPQSEARTPALSETRG